MCRQKGMGFALFWSENGYRFYSFWSGSGYGLRRKYGCESVCSSFQFQMNKKQSVICEFEKDLKTSFCGGFILSNDDIISVLCKHVMLRFVTLFQVWNRVWILETRSENGCGKWHFFVWNRVRIWRTERHIPTKNSQEYPPPPPRDGDITPLSQEVHFWWPSNA